MFPIEVVGTPGCEALHCALVQLHISQSVYWGNHKLKPDCCSKSKSTHTHKPICLILADHSDVVVTTYSLVSIPHSGVFWHHGSDLSQG